MKSEMKGMGRLCYVLKREKRNEILNLRFENKIFLDF